MLQNTSDKDMMLIPMTKKHIRATPISAEDYMRKQISRNNTLQTDDKLG